MRTRGTWAIITMTVAVFIADAVSHNTLLEWGAKSPAIWSGQAYRLITATFFHAGALHLASNMFALLMFGRVVEAVLGSSRFVVVYLLSGAIGYMFSLLAQPVTPAVGASAAIFGLMGYTLHYRLRRLPRRFLPIDTDLLQILVLNLAIGFLVPRIDQMAHIGGILGGIMAASLVGMPVYHQETKGSLLEPVLAALLIVVLGFTALQPIAAAKRIQRVVPIASHWLDARYGPYFSPLWANDITLLWLNPQVRAGWSPAQAVVRTPNGLVRLAVFWRWEKGQGAERAVPFQVAWERIGAQKEQTLQVDSRTALKPDTDASLIYARSDVVVSPGHYRVRVVVEGREVWQSSVEVVAGP